MCLHLYDLFPLLLTYTVSSPPICSIKKKIKGVWELHSSYWSISKFLLIKRKNNKKYDFQGNYFCNKKNVSQKPGFVFLHDFMIVSYWRVKSSFSPAWQLKGRRVIPSCLKCCDSRATACAAIHRGVQTETSIGRLLCHTQFNSFLACNQRTHTVFSLILTHRKNIQMQRLYFSSLTEIMCSVTILFLPLLC